MRNVIALITSGQIEKLAEELEPHCCDPKVHGLQRLMPYLCTSREIAAFERLQEFVSNQEFSRQLHDLIHWYFCRDLDVDHDLRQRIEQNMRDKVISRDEAMRAMMQDGIRRTRTIGASC